MTNYQSYPHCHICDAGGISQSDCPNCRSKITPWYRQQLAAAEARVKRVTDDYTHYVNDVQTAEGAAIEQLNAKLAAAEALLREAVDGMSPGRAHAWRKEAKEVCGDNV